MKPERTIFDDADDAAEASVDAAPVADVEARRFISDDTMKRWLRSWGAPDELSPPDAGE